MPTFIFRLLALGLGSSALLLSGASPAMSSTESSDPLFGEGCRYVVVETPTDADPGVTLCRPW